MNNRLECPKCEHRIRLIGRAEAAKICGISQPTFDEYYYAGYAPPPDVHLPQKPLWLRETIVAYQAARNKRAA